MLVDKLINAKNNYPESLCIVDTKYNKSYTFEEFFNFTKQIAYKLKNSGITNKDYVIIEIPNSIEYFASRFAVWMLGAAIVCLSDKTPANRKEYIKDHCGAKFSITNAFFDDINNSSKMLEEDEITNPNFDDNALLIYTSGTTGNPKGVLHSHGVINIIVERGLNYHNYPPFLKHASFPSVEFIVSIIEDAAALLAGHTVYIIPDEIKLNPDLLSRFIDENEINKMFIFSQLLKYIHPKKNTLIEVACAGSKACNVYSDKFKIYNHYGASEVGPMAYFLVDKEYENTPIGKCPSNERVYVLDKNGKKAKKGEMHFAGNFTKGYLKNPEETNKKIIDNPYKDEDGFEKLYKTGDVGELLDDGNLVYLYRTDFMVKINGQRVEPGEVEIVLGKMEQVDDICVKAFEDGDSIFLCAYYVAKDTISNDAFYKYASKYMRIYMIPTHYIKLNAIPRSANGKISYSELPKPKIEASRAEYVAPSTKLEESICNAFKKVFNLNKVSIHDSFVDLGGDSLSAIEIQSHIPNATFSILTEKKTPKNIAQAIKNKPDNIEDINYSIESGTPLTKGQRFMHYDGLLKENHYQYNIFIEYPVKVKKSIPEITNAVVRLINKHPILKARLGTKDGKPWIYYNGRPPITNYKCLISIDIKVSMCMFCIHEDKIECIFHHHIVDFLSVKIIMDELDKLLENKFIDQDLNFLRLPQMEENTFNKNKKKSYGFLNKTYKNYNMIETPFYFPKNENSMIVCRKFTFDTEKMQNCAKKINIPLGVFFMASYAQLVASYSKSLDVAFGYMTNERNFSGAANTVACLANRYIMRINKFDFETIEQYLKYFNKLYRNINKNSLWNALEAELEFDIHTDLYFNYIEESGGNFDQERHLQDFEISNLSTSRELMFTLTKNKNCFFAEFITPAYANKDLIIELYENYVKLLHNYSDTDNDFANIQKNIENGIKLKYSQKKITQSKHSEDEVLKLSSEISKTFRKILNISEYVKDNEIDFKKHGTSLNDALSISRELRLNGLSQDMPAIDIIRLKKPKQIAKQILNLKYWNY